MLVAPLWEESVNVQTCLGIKTQPNPILIQSRGPADDSTTYTLSPTYNFEATSELFVYTHV